jgi:hypothetical protein
VILAPERYLSRRAALDYDEVAYGVGGIALYRIAELDAAQIGYSVDTKGRPLVTDGPGSWSSEWIVIGNETACGDPIFLSATPPHPAFTAMHGQGEWTPQLVAPSIDTFWECLDTFRRFALHRGSPVEMQENLPNDWEIEIYLEDLLRLCSRDPSAVGFWAVQAQIGMEDERWRLRLERLLESGELG